MSCPHYHHMITLVSCLLALLPWTGCPATTGEALQRTVNVGIGAPAAVCPGTDRVVTARTTTTIRRLVRGTSDTCYHHVTWHGPLLAAAGDAAGALATGSQERVALVLREIQLVDELGAPVAGAGLGPLKGTITLEGQQVLTFKTDGRGFGLPAREPLAAELVEKLRGFLEVGKPVMARVEVAFALAPPTRRAIAARAMGPQLAFELSFPAE